MCIDGVTGLVASLTSLSSAECECGSMMPGVSHMPVASTTAAEEGAFTLAPTPANLAGMHPHGPVLDGAVAGGHDGGVLKDDVGGRRGLGAGEEGAGGDEKEWERAGEAGRERAWTAKTHQRRPPDG